MTDECPRCAPPLKTCASETCAVTYRRSEAGRADAIYCSRRCAQAQAARRFRRRRRDAAEAREWIRQFMDDYAMAPHIRAAFGVECGFR